MTTEPTREDEAPLEPEAPETAAGEQPEVPETEDVGEPTLEEIAVLRTDEIKDALTRARERDEFLDRLQRLQAEYDNFRKRVARERESSRRDALRGLLLEVLPVVDNLDRALASDPGPDGHDDFVRGVELVAKQVAGVLTKVGVKPIVAKGEPFDPALHEAVSLVPTAEVEPGLVVEEVQSGYTMDDVVLRATRVCVSQTPPSPEPVDEAPTDGDEQEEA